MKRKKTNKVKGNHTIQIHHPDVRLIKDLAVRRFKKVNFGYCKFKKESEMSAFGQVS